MPDLNLPWGGDLSLTTAGDIATVDGDDLGVQRVTRRLLTAPRALLFEPEYGAGLPQRVGDPTPVRTLTGLVRAQIFAEASVAQSPAPQVSINEIPSGSGNIVINVRWTDLTSGAPQLLSFQVGPG